MGAINWQEVLFFGVDFYLAWLLIYMVLKLIRTNSRALQIIKGVLLIYGLNVVSQIFELTILSTLTSDIITWGILAVIIIFQPEIRNGLEQVGRRGGWWKSNKNKSGIDIVDNIVKAFESLSKEHIGALIVIERKIGLDEFIEPATPIQAIITPELLKTIFFPKTDLHDGAMIIREDSVWCAGAILPSTKRTDLDQTVGTRHRAAIGVSEVSDCIVLVVSEESGRVSIAKDGELNGYEKIFDFEKALRAILKEDVINE